MMSDVDEEVGLEESFDDGWLDDWNDLHGGRCKSGLGDKDAGLEVVGLYMLREGAHLFDT